MIRRLAVAAACSILGVAVAACSGGGSDAGGPGHGTTTVRTGATSEKTQEAGIVLAAGRSSAQYRITAPSPASYEFDVTITAPASANVAVYVDTWYGTTLSILDSTHDRGYCSRRGAQDVCFERFPLLPAQLAGKWTVVASKRSEAAARVRISFTFAKA